MIDPKVSIIIPHRNQPDQLRKCLDRLMELGYGKQEIIVVDNNSEILPKKSDEYPIHFLRTDSPPSPYIARNMGISQASADIIVLLDVNVIVEPGWLENALSILRENSILGGIVARPDPAALDSFQRFDYLHSVIDPKSTGTIRALPAANLFFYKKIWDVVGPFQEVRSLGDMEWTSRAFGMGVHLEINPTVRFSYPFKTGKTFAAKFRRLGGGHAENKFHQNRIWYIVKNLLPPSPDFVRRMHEKNKQERMRLSMFQIVFFCYWVKINYAIGFLNKTL